MILEDLFETEQLMEAAVQAISPQEAVDRKMFGPCYHGTNRDIQDILTTGFSAKYSVPRTIGFGSRPVETTNGMPLESYAWGIAAPIHWLGFGTYFTTTKAIAKMFNGNSTKNLKTFYIDAPNILRCNFGAPNTAMKFWTNHGYDMTAEATKNRDIKAWIKATGNLTRNLRKYDAVHYLGKGIRKLLDGDQVCVYNPRRIYLINPKLSSGMDIGAKVFHTQVIPEEWKKRNDLYIDDIRPTDFSGAEKLVGWKGVFRAVDHDGTDIPRTGKIINGQNWGNRPLHFIPPANMSGIINDARYNDHVKDTHYSVKWAKGGIMHNYRPVELRPAKEKTE